VHKPLIVEIPHRLGKEEAIRRLKAGLGSARHQYSQLIHVNEEIWSGDRLAFAVTAMSQKVSGFIDVFEERVRIEVMLPWLLSRIAHGLQSAIQRRGALMLDKK
jgi:Putative polyhydroxyalkanoic acid system protein (PHA_gran_rgn)